MGGGNTMLLAPYDDIEYDIWTTPSVSRGIPKADMLFEFHDEDAYQKPEVYINSDVLFKKDFPVHELEKKYGKIFPSSMNLILAYAIELGYKHIELFGVDMAMDDEYERFRPSFLYLIGYARGLGVVVEISKGSALMPDEATYGYEHDMNRERILKIEKDLAEAERLSREYQRQADYLRGAKYAGEFFSRM